MTETKRTSTEIPRCALLVSGRGSNALAILEFQKSHPSLFQAPLLVTDNPDAGILGKTQDFQIDVEVCPVSQEKGLTGEQRRRQHEQKLSKIFDEYNIQWLLLAGYKRLLSAEFLSKFWSPERGHNRVLNIHPSLLPAYPGLDAYQRAFEDGVEVTGVTVHFVDAGMDTGPILAQEKFSRLPDDDLESFQARGLKIEHRLYPQVLKDVFLNQYNCSKISSQENLDSYSEG